MSATYAAPPRSLRWRGRLGDRGPADPSTPQGEVLRLGPLRLLREWSDSGVNVPTHEGGVAGEHQVDLRI